MRRTESRCCDCAVPGYPCIGNACKLLRVEVIYCDLCGAEVGGDDFVTTDDGQDICEECYKTEEGDDE